MLGGTPLNLFLSKLRFLIEFVTNQCFFSYIYERSSPDRFLRLRTLMSASTVFLILNIFWWNFQHHSGKMLKFFARFWFSSTQPLKKIVKIPWRPMPFPKISRATQLGTVFLRLHLFEWFLQHLKGLVMYFLKRLCTSSIQTLKKIVKYWWSVWDSWNL